MRMLSPPTVVPTSAAKVSSTPVTITMAPSSTAAPAVVPIAPVLMPQGVTVLDPTEVGEFVKDPHAEEGATSSAGTSPIPDFSSPLSSRDNRARIIFENVRSDVESGLWRDLDQEARIQRMCYLSLQVFLFLKSSLYVLMLY